MPLNKLDKIIIGIVIVVGISIAGFLYLKQEEPQPPLPQGASVFFPYQGGTGTGTTPAAGQLLMGNSSSLYSLRATSNSWDFDEFVASMSFDTNTSIASGGFSYNINSLDDANFFIGDGIAIGTTDVFEHTLTVNGHVGIIRDATASSQHALDIECDAKGFSGLQCLEVHYISGALTDGSDEALTLTEINQTDAVGGDISAFQILTTAGAATIYGMKFGVQVNPVIQLVGEFEDPDSASSSAGGDILSDVITDASNVTLFATNGDSFTVGNTVKFEEIEVILNTEASGAGVKPTFEFSTGTNTWTEFDPIDGTDGFRGTGIIAFEDDDIPTWATGESSRFYIRMTRTQVGLSTAPIESTVQIAAANEFTWTKDARINVVSQTLTEGLQVGGGSSVAHSRFGTGTAGHGLAANDDLLITGLFEVDDNAFFDAHVSVALNFEVAGSSSFTGDINFFDEIQPDGATCANNEILKKTGADNWDCAADATSAFDATAQDALTWSDAANASNLWTFDLSGTDPTLNFISGGFDFTGFASVSSNFEIGGYASVSGDLFITGNSTLTGTLDTTGLTTLGALTATGVIDFGGATSTEITNADGPTVNALGEVAVDSASDSFNFYDGAVEKVVSGIWCPTWIYDGPSAIENFGAKWFRNPVTIVEVTSRASGSNSVGWNMNHGIDGAITTNLMSGDKSASSAFTYTTFNDATLVDGAFLELEITSGSATIEELSVTVCYRETP